MILFIGGFERVIDPLVFLGFMILMSISILLFVKYHERKENNKDK